jgi:hypothetical protein
MTFPEITTSDIGCALYLFTHHCQLKKVEYIPERSIEPRYRMTFTGMNVLVWKMQYLAKPEDATDFSKLPLLFQALEQHMPVVAWERVAV